MPFKTYGCKKCGWEESKYQETGFLQYPKVCPKCGEKKEIYSQLDIEVDNFKIEFEYDVERNLK